MALKGIKRYLLKPRQIAINPKGKTGMSTQDISVVRAILKAATRRGELPFLTYSHKETHYNLAFRKDPLYIEPKHVDLKRTAIKVRRIIRRAFGDRYTVRLA